MSEILTQIMTEEGSYFHRPTDRPTLFIAACRTRNDVTYSVEEEAMYEPVSLTTMPEQGGATRTFKTMSSFETISSREEQL